MGFKISGALNTYFEHLKIREKKRVFKATSIKLNKSNMLMNVFIGSFVLMMTLKFAIGTKERKIIELYRQKNLIN